MIAEYGRRIRAKRSTEGESGPMGKPYEEIAVLYNGRGQRAGAIRRTEEGLVLYKRVDTNQHQLRRPPAWALDRDHIAGFYNTEWVGAEGKSIVLIDQNHKAWTVSLSHFVDKSFLLNRGHGQQEALVLKEWEHSDPKEAKQGVLL